MNWMPEAIRDGIIVILVISGPLVIAAAIIGLVIGVLQAATQVQEQTIGSALKIIGVFGLIIFAGFWMFQYLSQYTSRTISTAFTFIPKLNQKVVPTETEKGFTETSKERINTGFNAPLRVIPPEKLKVEEQEGGIPPNAPIIGVPEKPKAPPQVENVPVTIPKLPQQPKRPVLPLSDYQEPKTITQPYQKIESIPENDQTNNNQLPLINLVPGEEAMVEDKSIFNLWERESAYKEEQPSWLN